MNPKKYIDTQAINIESKANGAIKPRSLLI